MKYVKVETYYFKDDGSIPNNADLAVILYPGVFTERAEQTESIFNCNNWGNSWINGVFEYHHYHSDTHEVLGVVSGSATLMLGGEKGREVVVKAGDVVVLPAGTGHKKLESSFDFKVAGAYPGRMNYNVKMGQKGERPSVLENIKLVPIPVQDPVYGYAGPLLELWRKK